MTIEASILETMIAAIEELRADKTRLEIRCDDLRAERIEYHEALQAVARAQPNGNRWSFVPKQLVAMVEELRADRARLDWFQNHFLELGISWPDGLVLRAAIDAAMKGE